MLLSEGNLFMTTSICTMLLLLISFKHDGTDGAKREITQYFYKRRQLNRLVFFVRMIIHNIILCLLLLHGHRFLFYLNVPVCIYPVLHYARIINKRNIHMFTYVIYLQLCIANYAKCGPYDCKALKIKDLITFGISREESL